MNHVFLVGILFLDLSVITMTRNIPTISGKIYCPYVVVGAAPWIHWRGKIDLFRVRDQVVQDALVDPSRDTSG